MMHLGNGDMENWQAGLHDKLLVWVNFSKF